MFRFTIRDVLWVMVVVGLVCGWLAGHSKSQNTIRNRDAQVHQFAQKLAVATNQNVHVSNESGEYIVTPAYLR